MLVDSHCHLDFPDFEAELDAVIDRASSVDVRTLVTICTRVRRFDRLREIVKAYEDVWCSVGTHPHQAAEEADLSSEELSKIAQEEKVVAIGEAGLDYFYDKAPRDVQATVFRRHIQVARETQLPLIIHARDADEDVATILKEETAKGAFPFILHCFSSGADLARVGIELGGYVSFSGILTFKKSEELRSIAARIPLDRLLVETDAPYLAPAPHRGKRNEPSFVVNTARVLAEIHGLPEAEMADITTENFFRVFGKCRRPKAAG